MPYFRCFAYDVISQRPNDLSNFDIHEPTDSLFLCSLCQGLFLKISVICVNFFKFLEARGSFMQSKLQCRPTRNKGTFKIRLQNCITSNIY